MFLERAETWSPRDGRTFKTPVLSSLLVALMFAGISGVLVYHTLYGKLGGLGWLFAVPLILLTLLSVKTARRALGSANWVMIVKGSGVALKIRSYLNADLEKRDPVVCWIPREEIRAVRKVGGSRDVPGKREGQTTETDRTVALDIVLKHVATGELAEACAREKSFRGEGRMQFHHYPVLVPEPGVIRIPWSSRSQKLSPGIDKALALLGESFPVEAEVTRPHVDWRTAEGAELDQLVLDLCEAGNRIDAVKVLRLRNDMSPKEAKRFVDELMGREGKRAA